MAETRDGAEPNERLADFLKRIGPMTKSGFESRFPHPFLLLEFSVPEGEAAGDGRRPRAEGTVWKSLEDEEKLNALVALVVHSGRNRSAATVSAGRAPENDIVILHPSVSKVHALFAQDLTLGFWTIEDAGSTYGTLVEGELLRRGAPAALESGNAVVFAGSVFATFLDSGDFFETVQTLASP